MVMPCAGQADEIEPVSSDGNNLQPIDNPTLQFLRSVCRLCWKAMMVGNFS